MHLKFILGLYFFMFSSFVTLGFCENIESNSKEDPSKFMVMAEFECNQTSDTELECNSFLSRPKENIARYEWIVNNKKYIGEKQTFVITETLPEDIVDVTLTVVGLNNKTDSATHQFELKKLSLISLGTLELQAPKIFYKLSEKIQFKIQNTSMLADKRKNEIFLNGGSVSSDKINYIDENTIEINVDLQKGENELSFDLVDKYKRTLSKSYSIFAGDRNVKIDLSGTLGNTQLEIRIIETEEVLGVIEATGNSVEIQNLPPLYDFGIIATSQTARGVHVIFSEKNEYLLKLHNFEGEISKENTDMSEGFKHWELSGAVGKKGGELEMIPDHDILTLRRVLRVNKPEEKSISFTLSQLAVSPDDYYYISIRNQKTGEMRTELASSKRSYEMAQAGLERKFNFMVEVKNPNDNVEVEYSYFKKPKVAAKIK